MSAGGARVQPRALPGGGQGPPDGGPRVPWPHLAGGPAPAGRAGRGAEVQVRAYSELLFAGDDVSVCRGILYLSLLPGFALRTVPTLRGLE